MTAAFSSEELELSRLPLGQKALIARLTGEGRWRRRLLDLGFVPGSVVEAVRRSPLGDPVAFLIKGTVIALRVEQAQKVLVKPEAALAKGSSVQLGLLAANTLGGSSLALPLPGQNGGPGEERG